MPIPHLAVLVIALLSIHASARADELPGSAALFTRLDTNRDGQLRADEIPAEHQRLFTRLLRTGDINGDGVLTAQEFTAALTPSRPDKPLEEEQDGDFPGAKATRWLLLTLDANGDSRLTEDEIPADYLPAFDRLVEMIDRDEDGVLSRGEINRGGPQLARVALQTARRLEIDIERAHDRIVKKQGDRAQRFDETPNMRQALSDPKNAREIFARLDANSDSYLEFEELPEPLRERLARPFRRADANRDGRLSPQEFSTLTRRLGALSRFSERPPETRR